MIYVKSIGSLAARRVSALLAAGALAWGLAAGSALGQPAGQPQLNLPVVQLGAGMHLVRAQVAQTALQRQVGLMYRQQMPPNEGMLFVFEEPSPQCFWMRNTLLPLAIAFIADDGTVVNVDEMKPQTDDSHCSAKPVRYVLEMNQGWFSKRGIKAGFRFSGAPFQK
jgi:uncharacterized membrane protein (UPF0127 family)